MGIKIHGKRDSGQDFFKEISEDVFELNLSDIKLTEINLEFLSMCTNLMTLKLDNNKLSYLDLSPLSKCQKLENIFLQNNKLTSLEMEPLAKCSKLRKLNLADNYISSIDLSPLQNCSEIKYLYLDNAIYYWKGSEIPTHYALPEGLLKYYTQLKLVKNTNKSMIEISTFKENNMRIILKGKTTNDITFTHEIENDQTIIILSAEKLKNLDIEGLRNCKNLEELILSDNYFSSIDLSPLEECKNLKVLNLSNNLFTSINLKPLEKCKKLHTFDISNNKLSSIDISLLCKIEKLEKLNLRKNKFSVLNLQNFIDCENLVELEIDDSVEYFFEDTSLSSMVLFPKGLIKYYLKLKVEKKLKEVVSYYPKTSLITIKGRAEEGKAFILEIEEDQNIIDLSKKELVQISLDPLIHCKKLKTLFLDQNKLRLLDLSPLIECRFLETLHIDFNNLSYLDLKPLAQCKNLKILSLQFNRLSKLDLTPLEKCSELEMLILCENQFSSLNLKPLEKTKKLKKLDLDNNALSYLDLKPLINCLNLKLLNLFNNQLESLDLMPLKDCKQLQELNLRFNKLSSIDLTPLINCSNLKQLYLDDIEYIWSLNDIPEILSLPIGLQEIYPKLKKPIIREESEKKDNIRISTIIDKKSIIKDIKDPIEIKEAIIPIQIITPTITIKDITLNDIIDAIKNLKNEFFYYLTSKEHVHSILKNGILSKNKANSLGLIKKDLSWNSVQYLRDLKTITLTNNKNCKVHDLVPLYFNYKTPSNYRMWQKDNEIVLLCITKQILYSKECGFAFSDGNLADYDTRSYSDFSNLCKLDWNTINASNFDYMDDEIKRRRMSEFLVYPSIDPRFIKKIIVPNDRIAIEIEPIIEQENLQIKLIIDRGYFY